MTNMELIEKQRVKLEAAEIDIEELQVAAILLDRVVAGLCQNCGEKRGLPSCGCNYIGEEKTLARIRNYARKLFSSVT